MEKHRDNERNDQRSLDDDQARPDTTNEIIREVSGNPDMDLNNLREDQDEFDRASSQGSDVYGDVDQTQGVSYTPNDASGVRSGGITDMDDQTAGGAGLNTGVRQGLGSHLNTKKGLTGSDFDGQNATS